MGQSSAIESEVRSYCRRMPSVFNRAVNAEVWDQSGKRHIDLLAACGALNYGHNNPAIKERLIEYIQSDGIGTAMDLNTVAKRDFLKRFGEIILEPRGLSYRVQFPGPTGTNAVEAALKLARKVTKRTSVVAFSNGFHGMTLGALAATGNAGARRGAGVPLQHITRLPFEGFNKAGIGALHTYAALVEDASGGQEPPAAFLLETVQGEGGLNVASNEWLVAVQQTAKRLGALLIVDDVQAGCGRTGAFFSFERAAIEPDIVCLAKSIGGIGLPLALVLLKPEHDCWEPGEHNGTFRANSLALVAGGAALDFWRGDLFEAEIQRKARMVRSWIEDVCSDYPGNLKPKGLGLMQGIEFADPRQAAHVAKCAVERNLLIECCGPNDEVVKLLPPLTIDVSILQEALDKLRGAIDVVMQGVTCRVAFAAE